MQENSNWAGAGQGCRAPLVPGYLWSVEVPAGLTLQVTSPRGAGLALGLLIISLHLPTGKNGVCTGLLMMQFHRSFFL